jgi:hypothetical protein
MLAFGLTIFTGAFLLFLIQPLIAKFILPWFGGSPAVWSTCMLFFQILLLGGYAYAHFSHRRLAPRRQVILHLILIASALLLLPITPGDLWKPPDGAMPTWRILLLLTACLGLPYFVLSATGPLMQAWVSGVYVEAVPYRLFALSNLGSLLALAGYPFFVEPNFSRIEQAGWWSFGLGGFALLAAWCGAIVWRRAGSIPLPQQMLRKEGAAGPDTTLETPNSRGKAAWLWFALPACASVLLLAVTNKICQDIAVIPFLWVLPLGLYLLSFIISFDSPRWYWRPFWLPALTFALGTTLWMMIGSGAGIPDWPVLRPIRWLLTQASLLSLFNSIGIYLGTLFVCCMVCHGEVYRLRPVPRKLTSFYLMIAAGGALGGIFVVLLAPTLFNNYFELHIGLYGIASLATVVMFVDEKSPFHGGRCVWAWGGIILALIGFGAGLYHDAAKSVAGNLVVSRSFYGVLKVSESRLDDPEAHELTLEHGGTQHGLQFVSPRKRRWPTTYYTSASGISRAMAHFPRKQNRRVGVAGLGVGTLAAFGKAGDYFRFYEINDQVRLLAQNRFWYLVDSPARIEIVLGDARLSMEREPDQRFDILVLDAFSSDAIPVHLLTCEAFEIYLRHLRPDGVIAVNISNRYLNMEPVVTRTADHFSLGAALIYNNDSYLDYDDEDDENSAVFDSDWVLLSRNADFLKLPAIREASTSRGDYSPKIGMWTDDKSNLLQILDVDADSWLGWLRRLAL